MGKKRKHKKHLKPHILKKEDEFPIESDHNFGFIMGYTSGGDSYGLTHDEWNAILEEEKINSTKT